MAQAETEYPDWLCPLFPDPVRGLENFAELFKRLTTAIGSIQVFCEVADL